MLIGSQWRIYGSHYIVRGGLDDWEWRGVTSGTYAAWLKDVRALSGPMMAIAARSYALAA